MSRYTLSVPITAQVAPKKAFHDVTGKCQHSYVMNLPSITCSYGCTHCDAVQSYQWTVDTSTQSYIQTFPKSACKKRSRLENSADSRDTTGTVNTEKKKKEKGKKKKTHVTPPFVSRDNRYLAASLRMFGK